MPQDNVTTWVNCSPDEIKVGMRVKVVEKYKTDDEAILVTIEGKVTALSPRFIFFDQVGAHGNEASSNKDRESQFYREPKRLPLALGSAIKVYDPNLLCDRLAIRQVRPGAETRRETGWYFADPGNGLTFRSAREVPERLIESAEILFDAGAA